MFCAVRQQEAERRELVEKLERLDATISATKSQVTKTHAAQQIALIFFPADQEQLP